jgi:hypothetical protein
MDTRVDALTQRSLERCPMCGCGDWRLIRPLSEFAPAEAVRS